MFLIIVYRVYGTEETLLHVFFLFILKLYNDPFTITTIGSFVYAIEPMHYTSCPVKTNAYVNM